MLDFVGKRYWYFLLSIVILVPGLISLIAFGLKPGIEFSSGSTMTLKFEQPVNQADLRAAFAEAGHADAISQSVGENSYLIRTRMLKPEQKDAEGKVIAAEKEQIEQKLKDQFGVLTVLDFYSVSPIVASEIVRNTAIALIVASVAILLYITWAFRKVPKAFRYGVSAVVAMIHDVILVVGVFSLLGKFLNVEINAMFIVGVLTVIGYSVHDTIVVFDRIRENIKVSRFDFPTTVNNSIMETLGRSLNTGLTTIFVLLALLFFGGVTIRDFILVLLIGIITGTYSSIFIASQLLVVWENGEVGRFFRKRVLRRAEA